MNYTQQQSICYRIFDRRCFGMFVVCKNRFLPMNYFVWRSTPAQVTDPMTGRTGSVREVILDTRGSAFSWRSTWSSVQMLTGTWPVTVMSAGRNDPSSVLSARVQRSGLQSFFRFIKPQTNLESVTRMTSEPCSVRVDLMSHVKQHIIALDSMKPCV